MEKAAKDRIIDAAKDYMFKTQISQNELKKLTKISYLNSMINGVYTFTNQRNNTTSEIDDKYFNMLADYIGFRPNVLKIPVVETVQSKIILYELEKSKMLSYSRVLIGGTGCGKTFLTNQFKKVNPIGTYSVICDDFDTPGTLIDKIMEATDIKCGERLVPKRLQKLRIELWRQHKNDKKPVVILDEAENLQLKTMKLFKSLYDYLQGGVGLTFIGTQDLLTKFEMYKKREAIGFPQFYRRFKSGVIEMPDVDPAKHFDPFFNVVKISNDAKKLMINNCDDYDTLTKYLNEALQETQGAEITADLLTTIHPNLIY